MSMRIKCSEPISQKYIYVDPRTNHVHLVMPLVGGETIGLDNTCQTVVELQRFFGKNMSAANERKSAIHELERYRAALEKDIGALDNDKVKKAKKDRLEQVKEYLKALRSIENEYELASLIGAYPSFPEAIKQIMARQTNVLSMQLSPSHPDHVLKAENPVFSVSRGGITVLSKYDMRDSSVGLGPTLRQELASLTIGPKQDAKALVSAAVVKAFGKNAINNEADFNRLKTIIRDQIKTLYNVDVDLSKMYKPHPITKEQSIVTKEFLDTMLGFDEEDKDKIGEYFDAIVGACLSDDFWNTLKTESAFNLIKQATSPVEATANAEKLSIMTQFFLGQVNIFCFSKDLSRTNFGKVLDDNASLSLAVARTVKESLARSQNVEENLFKLINEHYRDFGLSRPLKAEECNAIATRFNTEYSTIKDSPHFDEFTLLTPEKKGDFANHHGTIALSFAQFMEMQFPGKSNRFFRDRAREFRDISGTLAHKNASVAADYEIDEKKLPKMLESSKNIDTIASILTAEVAGSERRVFQNLPPHIVSELMRSKNFDQLKASVISKLTDRSLQALFNQQFSTQVQTFQLTTAMERSLYTRVIDERGPHALDNLSNTPRPDKLNKALQLLNIKITDPGIQVSEGEGFIIHCPPDSVREIVETHQKYQNSIHLTKDMARSLYMMVEERFGAMDGRYIEMQSKDNLKQPDKINLALRLLDVRPQDIHFSEWDGYILTATPAAINNINTMHHYITTRPPRPVAAAATSPSPISAMSPASATATVSKGIPAPTKAAMSPAAAAASTPASSQEARRAAEEQARRAAEEQARRAAEEQARRAAQARAQVTGKAAPSTTPAAAATSPLSKSPPNIPPRENKAPPSAAVSPTAQAAEATGTQKVSPRGKLERAGQLNPELLKMAGMHRQSPSPSSATAAATSPTAASSALASSTGADNQPPNINALMRQPYIPQIVQEGAQRSVNIYRSPTMASVVEARKQKARAGGRGSDWIQKTTGETENTLIEKLKSIPAPRTYSCGEIKNAMGAEKSALQSTGPTFHIVEGLSVNYLHDAPLGQESILMVASQFDFQEAMGPFDAPVSSYINDPTQGPQAQIETLWAALHRKAAKLNNTLPHALTDILPVNLLSKYPQLYQHGYLDLNAITDSSDKQALLTHIKANIDKLKVLPQWAICEASGAKQLQVCCAAPSFQGRAMPEPGSIDDQICQAMVVAQYVATAQLAVLRSRETGQPVPLHLTMVGQGAFKNRPEVIREAMRQVAEVVKDENVQVFVHAFSATDKANLTAQLNTGHVHYDSMPAERFLTLQNPALPQAAAPAAASSAAPQASRPTRPSILPAFSGVQATAQAYPAAAASPAPTPVQTQNITLYSARMSEQELAAGQHRLAIKFPSQAQREAFIEEFKRAAEASRMPREVFESLFTKVSANPDTLYLEPSKQRGPGVYVSANGELSVNLANNTLRDFFKNHLGINVRDAMMPIAGQRGDNALYFNRERLPPMPDRTKSIQTVGTSNIVSEEPGEEKRGLPKKK